MSEDLDVRNNETEERYEVRVDGVLAVLEYKRRGDEIAMLHTEVPKAIERRGIGSALAKTALDDARDRGLTVDPLCPFIGAFIDSHPEYLPLVQPSNRGRLARAD